MINKSDFMLTRSPIVVVLGHVDHGKTSLLDAIRGTAITKKEAGQITQMIGTSYVPQKVIKEISKPIAEKINIKLTVPGLLFIDTPGHESFASLRERGGNIADIAILVVDVTQSFQPQTIESIKILKSTKTPFVIAANKIDLITGWKNYECSSFFELFSKQPEFVQNRLDEKIYEIAGKISEHGFDSERFDRLTDFTKQVAIIPTSAKTKKGLSELLLLVAGLSQKFLEKKLALHPESPAKGSIIEVDEETGLGATLNVIIYDGVLKEEDEILFVGKQGVKKTKIRALLEPSIKNSKEKYVRIPQIVAAGGVKISAPGLEDAISGSPLIVVRDYEKEKKELASQIKKIIFENQNLGVVIKADSLGSIEAIIKLFKASNLAVKSANIGNVTKNDVLLALSVNAQDKYSGVVFAFNVQILPDAKLMSEESKIPIIHSNIIYKLLEEYEDWKKQEKEKEKKEVLEKITWPCKIKVLQGCFFRMSKPAIFGIEVLIGKLKPDFILMKKNGKILEKIKNIQKEKENVQEIKKGDQAAISLDKVTLNKDVKEGEELLAYISKNELKIWKEKKSSLSEEEKQVLDEIEKILYLSI